MDGREKKKHEQMAKRELAQRIENEKSIFNVK